MRGKQHYGQFDYGGRRRCSADWSSDIHLYHKQRSSETTEEENLRKYNNYCLYQMQSKVSCTRFFSKIRHGLGLGFCSGYKTRYTSNSTNDRRTRASQGQTSRCKDCIFQRNTKGKNFYRTILSKVMWILICTQPTRLFISRFILTIYDRSL